MILEKFLLRKEFNKLNAKNDKEFIVKKMTGNKDCEVLNLKDHSNGKHNL